MHSAAIVRAEWMMIVAAMVVLGAGVCLSQADDTYWQWDPATGNAPNWADPMNWSDGVPGRGTIAHIDADGAAEIVAEAEADEVILGDDAGGSGTLLLTDGSLTLKEMRVGDVGKGVFRQTGGELLNRTYQIGSGLFGPGAVHQTGGVCHTAPRMNIHSSGEYVLDAGSLISGRNTRVWGRFELSGGQHTIDGILEIATSSSADKPALYELNAGALDARILKIGRELRVSLPGGYSGIFTQRGGVHDVGCLVIEPAGRYDLLGGQLRINDGLHLAGEVNCEGEPVAIEVGDNAIVNVTDATFVGTDQASLTLGADSLLVYRPSQHPAGWFKSFSTQGRLRWVMHSSWGPVRPSQARPR